MLTDQDIEKMKSVFATKEDLGAFATKEDLDRFATKEDLGGFATKKDLGEFATKEYVHEEITMLRREMQSDFTDIKKDLKSVLRIHNLDEEMAAVYNRLQKLEQTVGIN